MLARNKITFTSEQIVIIISRYLAGESTIKIGIYFSVNFKKILKTLRENNIQIRKQNVKLSAEQKEEIIKLYNSGNSATSIAKNLNIKPIFIQKLIRNSVAKTRPSYEYLKKFSDDILNNIITDYFAKLSYKQLAEKYSCSETLVKKEIKSYLNKTNNIFCRECRQTKNKALFFDKKQFCICNDCRNNISVQRKYKRNKKRYLDRLGDPKARIHHSISSSIRNHLKNNGKKFSALPYSGEDVIKHLESLFEPWMNWNNYGKYDPKCWNDDDPLTWTWQVDHIIPASTFKYSSIEDESFKKCWALSNLRPLNSKQNYLDGVRRTRHKKA